MKVLLAAALAAASIGSALAQPSVGVSIGINQPGVYGQINIGNLPAPALVAPQPVIIAPAPGAASPVYMYVPIAEQHDWRRYCRKYNACGRPVYFVRDQWVRERYTHEHPGWDRRHVPPPHEEHRQDERRDRDHHD
jgi:hypothetical protein